MDRGSSLYQRYLDGDNTALVELIDEYREGLLLYLGSMTASVTFAEEVMEDTFFKIVTRKPSFRGRSSFKTWLFAIARNTAIDKLRKSSRISTASIEDFSDLAAQDNIELEYLRKEQKIQLHKALRRLNQDYQQVLYLTYFEGFTTEETARIMRRSRKQIGNLLYRAKQSLKSELRRGGFRYENI